MKGEALYHSFYVEKQSSATNANLFVYSSMTLQQAMAFLSLLQT